MNHAVPNLQPKERPLRGLIAAGLDYLRARLRLFTSEAKDAGGRLGVMSALAGGLVVLCAMGYILLVLAVVFGIAAFFDSRSGWAWATLIAALVHFVIATVLLLMLKRKTSDPFFPQSIEELKKDQQWLTQNPRN